MFGPILSQVKWIFRQPFVHFYGVFSLDFCINQSRQSFLQKSHEICQVVYIVKTVPKLIDFSTIILLQLQNWLFLTF